MIFFTRRLDPIARILRIDLKDLKELGLWLGSASHHCTEFIIVDSSILRTNVGVRTDVIILETKFMLHKVRLTLSVSTSDIISLMVSSSPIP